MNEVESIEDSELGGCHLAFGSSVVSGGNIRTFFIFLDLPQHLEFRAGEMPIMSSGDHIELDIALKHPRNHKKMRKINGKYLINQRILKYSSGRSNLMGLSQYLELKPV